MFSTKQHTVLTPAQKTGSENRRSPPATENQRARSSASTGSLHSGVGSTKAPHGRSRSRMNVFLCGDGKGKYRQHTTPRLVKSFCSTLVTGGPFHLAWCITPTIELSISHRVSSIIWKMCVCRHIESILNSVRIISS